MPWLFLFTSQNSKRCFAHTAARSRAVSLPRAHGRGFDSLRDYT